MCSSDLGDGGRRQSLFLYHPASGRRLDLGALDSPKEFSGEWRCDLHPRVSPDGRFLCVDSPHAGGARQMYLIDIAGLTEGEGS